MPKLDPDRGKLELSLMREHSIIIGVDEVGRGCLAGPVVTGAVVLDYDLVAELPEKESCLIRDSKTLSEKQRKHILTILEPAIRASAIGVGSVDDIQQLGIVPATFLAMRRAICEVKGRFNASESAVVLVDGNQEVAGYNGTQQAIVRGDASVLAIAAASIVAKQWRDEKMRVLASQHPGYGFERHVGYGTKLHLEGIKSLGPCQIHRMNFAPLKNWFPENSVNSRF